MEPKSSLSRFIFLGTSLPYYVRKRELVQTGLHTLINVYLSQINVDTYLKMIEGFLDDDILPRKDELWFTYAAFLIDSSTKVNDRKKLKLRFSKLATKSEDLFAFVKYAKDILKELKRNNLSGPIKDTILQWYKIQNTTKLIEMISINRGMYKFEHKDLIKMCHINLKSIGKQDIEKYIFKRCNRFVKDNETINTDKLSKTIEKLNDVSKLKISTDINLMKDLIKEKKLKLDHVPNHVLNRTDIFEALLPQLSYRLLIKYIHMIVETKMLGNVSFSKAYFNALNNRDLIRSEKLHPIFFLFEKNKQLKQARYSEKIKQSFYAKKIQKLNVKPNLQVNKKLIKLFETSFDGLPSIGLRIFITINLQESYKKKGVCTQKQTGCMEAAITLAFSYFKSENKTAVYTYCSDSSKLEPIPWTKDCNYKKANEICEKLINKKNIQKTYLPVTEAIKKGEEYDLFLVIVPSAARGNPSFKPTKCIEALETYRSSKNPKARMVFVNLRRFKPAMIHQPGDDHGILEICGLDENTPKLINAFALHRFS